MQSGSSDASFETPCNVSTKCSLLLCVVVVFEHTAQCPWKLMSTFTLECIKIVSVLAYLVPGMFLLFSKMPYPSSSTASTAFTASTAMYNRPVSRRSRCSCAFTYPYSVPDCCIELLPHCCLCLILPISVDICATLPTPSRHCDFPGVAH